MHQQQIGAQPQEKQNDHISGQTWIEDLVNHDSRCREWPARGTIPRLWYTERQRDGLKSKSEQSVPPHTKLDRHVS